MPKVIVQNQKEQIVSFLKGIRKLCGDSFSMEIPVTEESENRKFVLDDKGSLLIFSDSISFTIEISDDLEFDVQFKKPFPVISGRVAGLFKLGGPLVSIKGTPDEAYGSVDNIPDIRIIIES
jgi:hypothetical protein